MEHDDFVREMETSATNFEALLSQLRPSGGDQPDFERQSVIDLVEAWIMGVGWMRTAISFDPWMTDIASRTLDAKAAVGEFLKAKDDARSAAIERLVRATQAFLGFARGGGRDVPSMSDSSLAVFQRAISLATLRTDVAKHVEARFHDLDELTSTLNERTESAVKELTKLVTEAKEASRLASEAAAESSTSALGQSFETVATEEFASEKKWTRATIVVLVVIVLIGAVLLFIPTSTDDWHFVVYRVAIISALAAFAAYCARQATHHRRQATWARAIEIQLRAFRGFVEPIRDENAREKMYELFGRRVLQSPPESGGGTGDDVTTNIFQPVIDGITRGRP